MMLPVSFGAELWPENSTIVKGIMSQKIACDLLSWRCEKQSPLKLHSLLSIGLMNVGPLVKWQEDHKAGTLCIVSEGIIIKKWMGAGGNVTYMITKWREQYWKVWQRQGGQETTVESERVWLKSVCVECQCAGSMT
jgi:hypothetical protein